jgi:hypothetical protein
LETGRFVGSAVLPARPDGRPPRASLGDIVGLIGGYRLASIYVEIESERLAKRNLAVSDRLRRRDRSWLRRAEHHPVRDGSQAVFADIERGRISP